MIDDLETARRMAAARAYAGMSLTDLAEIVEISKSTLHRIESADRHLKAFERKALLPAIAEACGLPVAWFTADFGRLEEIPG